MTAAKTTPAPRLRRLERGQGQHAQRPGPGRHDTPRVAPPPAGGSNDRRRRTSGETSRTPSRGSSENNTATRRPRRGRSEGRSRRGDAHVHGQEVGEQPRAAGAAPPRPRPRPAALPTRPMAAACGEVDREDVAGARAEAAEDRDRLHPALDERVDRAGHAQAAEQHRHEGDQAEVAAEVAQRLAERPLVLGHRAEC